MAGSGWLGFMGRFGPLRTFIIALSLGVSLAFVAIFLGIYYSHQNLIVETVEGQASSYFDLILKAREWNSLHAGVYVEKGPGVETNPYLAKMGVNPEIKTADGRVLTLRNPAMMTKEITGLTKKDGGTTFHITSLKFINPENAPDGFERNALGRFERGEQEIWNIDGSGGEPVFRYMRPLYVTEGCLSCHSSQGYRLGDVRGGISVNLPFGGIQKRLDNSKALVALLCILTVSMFLGMMYYMSSRLAKQLDESQEMLRQVSITDGLTGLKNRRFVMERLWEEFQKARRTGSTLGVLMLDLDHFKRINDTYGHPFGDVVLKAVAERIRSHLRAYDIPGRIGGEEFLVLTPGTTIDDTAALGERIREVVRAQPIGDGTTSITVTVSIGVTECVPGDDTPEALLHRVDNALYRAKELGRDNVFTM